MYGPSIMPYLIAHGALMKSSSASPCTNNTSVWAEVTIVSLAVIYMLVMGWFMFRDSRDKRKGGLK